MNILRTIIFHRFGWYLLYKVLGVSSAAILKSFFVQNLALHKFTNGLCTVDTCVDGHVQLLFEGGYYLKKYGIWLTYWKYRYVCILRDSTGLRNLILHIYLLCNVPHFCCCQVCKCLLTLLCLHSAWSWKDQKLKEWQIIDCLIRL